MAEKRAFLGELRREHPVFFWGVFAVLVILVSGTVAVASRIPRYQQDAALLDERMSETEKETRDRILDSRTRRSELALGLLQRQLRLKALEEKGLHLAINTEDSTLSLRHGPATLREVPLQIGPDSVIRAPGGETWRLIRALGERHLQAKEVNPTVTVPEWVYVSRGEAVPPEEERRVEGALGRYVLRLDDGTEIYSTPKEGPFAGRVRPAGFMASEQDLGTIFDAIETETPVYIY